MPSLGRLTEVGYVEQYAPGGPPEHERSTVPEKPPIEYAVQALAEVLVPGLANGRPGHDKEKSGMTMVIDARCSGFLLRFVKTSDVVRPVPQ